MTNTATHPGETAQLTADVAVFHQGADGVLHVLVVERGHEPYAGRRALPGGFLDPGEASADAARRELVEETSIGLRPLVENGQCTELVKVGTYDAPGRDPRGRISTTAYAVAVDHPMNPAAADDAAAAEWVRVDDLLAAPDALAFDHAEILTDAVEAIRQKLTGHEIEAGATVTVDAVLFHQDADGAVHVLLVERSQPIRGQLAIPGGFVGVGEQPNDAVGRELAEETGVRAPDGLTLVGVHGHPGTDPMDEVVKLVYAAVVDTMPEPTGGDDAIGARWVEFTPDLIEPGKLAFDHADLLSTAYEWARPQFAGTDLSADSAEVRELYRERAHLVAALAALYPARIAYNDPREPALPVLYLHTKAGQVSYHLNPDDLDLFGHVPVADGERSIFTAWDGHDKATALQRLRHLAQLKAPEVTR